MSEAFPDNNTASIADLASEAVRGYYSWLNIADTLGEEGETELADLSEDAAEACRTSARGLLGILNPENAEDNPQRQV